ncbi:MAG TPA: NADP-dependent oxidoreductase [Thermoanaerobaculia bacterium]|nr:NADP-dependent oxidoreductase [Thermoanaerobaculia bacterium]
MKAIQIHEYGGAQVLRYEDVPRPEPGDGEVLVRVLAAGVNPFDWKVRSGGMKEMIPLPLPWIPGNDFSGVVESARGVTDLHPCDEVFGRTDIPNNGSYAEYVAVHRSALAAKPRTVDHVYAAAVPGAALTAWQALFGDSRGATLELRAGQTVLILGASGGVGSFAVQLAKWKGARVIATSHRPGAEAHLRALGVDTIIDLERQKLEEAGQVDAVLDLVGGNLQQRAWSQVRRGGALASTMGPPSEEQARARGARAIAVFTQTNAGQLAEIAELIDAGSLEVVVSETVPLESARRAHELLESGGVRGKIVLTVAAL